MTQCERPEDVSKVATSLRQRRNECVEGNLAEHRARVVRALAKMASLWEDRLNKGWVPPANISFPWSQVRLSLASLLRGFAESGEWVERSGGYRSASHRPVTALILAGNTPLLAWSPLTAALLAGSAVFVKQSRDETLWARLFVESLSEVDTDLASLIHLDLWPGDDPRTAALTEAADNVIAYGNDATLETLRGITPTTSLFLGFGHAVSIGIVAADGTKEAGAFARDILLYDQGGCLSAQALLVEEPIPQSGSVQDAARNLAHSLEQECSALRIPPVTDPARARAVRQARDMALFQGYEISVISDPELRWTLLLHSSNIPLELATGFCVVQVVPMRCIADDLHEQLGTMKGYISSVGIAGTLSVPARQAILAEGASRICKAGEMQMPPLDWPNGGKNLLAELLKTG